MMKTMIHLLIDGYNLLYAIERGYVADLETKRQRLLEQLHRYQVKKGHQITIAFDASENLIENSHRDKYGEILVIYAASADDWIHQECERKPGHYVVVSNDLEVIAAAEKFSSLSVRSDEFILKLRSLSSTAEENPYFEDKEDEGPLYPKISTKKKGVAKRLPKKERRKHHQLKNL